MNKKILFGSIIAVAVLIGVSFTSVVGFQSVKSNSVKASPLFTVRTKRAIDEESKDLTCGYVGKGEEITLSIPKLDGSKASLQKAMGIIRKMDDATLEKLIAFLISHAQRDKRFNDENSNEIKEALYLLRDSDESIPIFDADTKNKNYTPLTLAGRHETFFLDWECYTFNYGIKGFLVCLLLMPLFILNFIGTVITWIATIITFLCYPW